MAAPEQRSWGIEPVPDRLRVLGTLDTGLLWGNLGVSLLVIVAGAALVPALSLPHALLAILLGCVIGNSMLGIAGAIGADARVPGMVLMRAPLGRRGSYLPTGINVVQGLGWSIFELLIIATAAAALSDELFGFRAQWLWTLVFGAVAFVLALLGPIGFVRSFVRRIAVWAVPFALVYLTWWALDGADLGALWEQPGQGGISVWQGADIVVAITVSWVPLAADYTRFSTSKRAGGLGAGVGYFVPDAWLLALGVLLVLSRDLSDPGALPAAVVAGGFAAILALFALLVTETDEAFANVYSASVSLQNLAPRAPQPLLIAAISAIATVGALVIDLVSYQSFLLLLGSVFVPLFAVSARRLAGRREALHRGRRLPRAELATRAHCGVARGIRALPVAVSDRSRLVGGARREARSAGVGPRRDRPELRRILRDRRCGVGSLPEGDRSSCAHVTDIATFGHLTRDVVDGGPTAAGWRRVLRGTGARRDVREGVRGRFLRRGRPSSARRRRSRRSACRSAGTPRRRRVHTASTTRVTGGSCDRMRWATRGCPSARWKRPRTRPGSMWAHSSGRTFRPRRSPRWRQRSGAC